MSTVLIVEDEILELDFLKSQSEKILLENDKLLTCQTGVNAVKLAKEYEPNVILMDILIPEIDGLVAIEKIRTFLPNACITILTAYSDFSYAQRAIDLNVYKYLLKPIRLTKFNEVLQEMLDLVNTESCNPQINENHLKEITNPIDHQKCFIDESIEYIKENFRKKLTLEEVASKTFMNPKYFSRVFKEQVGTSFSCYVNNLKIQYACRLLETSNYPAYRIAMECGFSDSSYFNRVFSAKMNMTPMAYRKYSRLSK